MPQTFHSVTPVPLSLARRFFYSLTSWGCWQGWIMVLLQVQIGLDLGANPNGLLLRITFAGALAVYGLDRALERVLHGALAPRHRAEPFFDAPMLILTLILLATGLFSLPMTAWPWLALLATLTALYLCLSLGLLKTAPGMKETLGAACLVVVVFGPHVLAVGFAPARIWVLAAAVFFIGLSNFLWAGFQDRDRDQLNQITSMARSYPAFQGVAARTCGILAAGLSLFAASIETQLILGLIGLAHGLFPRQTRWSVDLCFAPLIWGSTSASFWLSLCR